MVLIILRCVFLMVAFGVAVHVAATVAPPKSDVAPWLIAGSVVLLAGLVIALDMLTPRKRLDVITAVYFGLLVGLFMTYIIGLALVPLSVPVEYQNPIRLILGSAMCYLCISVLLQTKDDFRFVIPYVEFSREIKGMRPWILDTSVVIDGRIADLVETGAIDAQLIMPEFAIAELQSIADSSDRLRRGRGRRGLDILDRLRNSNDADLQIFDRELPEFAGQSVDLKLVALARHLQGKLITNDYNLNKVARLHGVAVVNLNDLANSLKPLFLPGEQIEVRIVKPGEEAGQGIGYLEDGTMVVVEGGRDFVGKTVAVAVSSVLQKSAGRMVFGKVETVRQASA